MTAKNRCLRKSAILTMQVFNIALIITLLFSIYNSELLTILIIGLLLIALPIYIVETIKKGFNSKPCIFMIPAVIKSVTGGAIIGVSSGILGSYYIITYYGYIWQYLYP